MKFFLSLLILLATSSTSFALGGAIGGGEVSSFPLFKCQANALIPKFNKDVKSLLVSGEADFDGNLIASMTVTIILQDAQGNNLDYLPTHTIPKDFIPDHLITYEYPQSINGQINRTTSKLQVTGSNGYLLPSKSLKIVDMLKLVAIKKISWNLLVN